MGEQLTSGGGDAWTESSPLVSGSPSLRGYVRRHVPLIPGAGREKKEMLPT